MTFDNTIAKANPRAKMPETDKAHGFFKCFPRELRDQIYDLIFQEEEEVVEGWHYKIRATLPKVRLINHQFQSEYDERPSINSFIEASECHLVEWYCLCVSFLGNPCPPLATRTTSMHINLSIYQQSPDRGSGSLDRHFLTCVNLRPWYDYWMESFLGNLPFLRKVTMDVGCSNMTCALTLQSCPDDIWPETPNLSRIVLLSPWKGSEDNLEETLQDYLEYGNLPPHSAEFFERREAMATWTPGHGWQADAKVIEECRKSEASFMEEREAV